VGGRAKPGHDTGKPGHDTGGIAQHPTSLSSPSALHRWLLTILPPALAVLGLCTTNLAAHGRFAIAPFGNVFLLARVIYDGPGRAILRRDCPTQTWLLCPFLDSFPANSDDFLWTKQSPLYRAGGPKAVSRDAGAIIAASLLADPATEAQAALANALEQLTRFASGDGLNAWSNEVSPVIARHFPAREQAAYAAARQQAGLLAVPAILARVHTIVALAGTLACVLLLVRLIATRHAASGQRAARRQHAACAGFLIAALLTLPLSAAITGALSAPHDRYQARCRLAPIAYSMYLVHFALLATSLRMAEWLIPALDVRTMLLHFAFTLVGSFALASVTYRYVEVPAIRWAAKYSHLRSVPVVSSV
jgi:hypothetical protein